MTSILLDPDKMRTAAEARRSFSTELRDQGLTIGLTAPMVAPPRVKAHMTTELFGISKRAIELSVSEFALSANLAVSAFQVDVADGTVDASSIAAVAALVPGGNAFVSGYTKVLKTGADVTKKVRSFVQNTSSLVERIKKNPKKFVGDTWNRVRKTDFKKAAKTLTKSVPGLGQIALALETGVGLVTTSGSALLADVFIRDPQQRKYFDEALEQDIREGNHGTAMQLEQLYSDVLVSNDSEQLERMKNGEYGSAGRAIAAQMEAQAGNGDAAAALGKEAVIDYLYEMFGQDRYEVSQPTAKF